MTSSLMIKENTHFKAGYVRLRPHEQIGKHINSNHTWEVSWVITGAGQRTIGGYSERFAAGEVVLVPPGIVHNWEFFPEVTDDEGYISNITVTFGEPLLSGLAALFPEMADGLDQLKHRKEAQKFGPATARRLTSLLKEIADAPPRERIAPMIRLLADMIKSHDVCPIGGEYAGNTAGNKRLKAVEIYVVCNASSPIKLYDVARHVGMSRTAFCTFFKKAAGRPFVDYLTEYRIMTACRMLCETSLSVREVGYAAGFRDIPHFNRVFKRLKHCTPGQYRDRAAEKNTRHSEG